jgi:hypothetical protein
LRAQCVMIPKADNLLHIFRQREDTIRCIVSSLTDDTNSELFQEFSRGKGRLDRDDGEDSDNGEEEEEGEEETPTKKSPWFPDPADAGPSMCT